MRTCHLNRAGCVAVLTLALMLVTARSATSTCVCGNLASGCASSTVCLGSAPGAACSMPPGGACFASPALGFDAATNQCCCGCLPAAASGACGAFYGGLKMELPALTGAAEACGNRKLDRATAKAVRTAGQRLAKVAHACLMNRAVNPDATANAVAAALTHVKTKVDALTPGGQVMAECGANVKSVVDGIILDSSHLHYLR